MDPHVLVVDDEPDLLNIMSRRLERSGFRVTGAIGAAAALKLWPEVQGSVQAIVCDLSMPGGMGGVELIQSLRSADQMTRAESSFPAVIFVSGHSPQSPEFLAAEQEKPLGIFAKPVPAKELVALLQELMHGSPETSGIKE